MKPIRTVGVIVAAIVLLVAGLYLLGVVRPPTVTVEDEGDWGRVTDDRTEIVTTLRIENPNPIGVSVQKGITATYNVSLNDVRVARGQHTGIEVPPGMSTTTLSTNVSNERIAPWWVAFVRANETVTVSIDGRIRASAFGFTTSRGFPARKRTMLENETPIVDSMTGALSTMEGSYTRRTTIGTGPVSETVTVGYDVERAWATWGAVNRSSTVLLFHVRLHNPSRRVPMPAVPDGIEASIDVNDVSLVDVRGDGFGTRSVDRDAVIAPGETREVVYVAVVDNERIDDWFRSHVRRGERSTIEVRASFLFEVPRTGTTVRVPGDGQIPYTCEMQTAILVDDQESATTCGASASVSPEVPSLSETGAILTTPS